MSDQPDTKERILETALEVFAEKGFEGSSLRAITTGAGVNLASVNYHFGSKEGLFGAVFARLLGPVNEERLARLDRIEEAAGDGPLPLEEVVEAFIAPPLLRWHEGGTLALRFLGRIHTEASDHIHKIFLETFGEVIERYIPALARCVPGLDPQEVGWRLLFTVGAMAHTMALHHMVREFRPGTLEVSGAGDLIRRLVPFLCAGFQAPAPGSRKRGRR